MNSVIIDTDKAIINGVALDTSGKTGMDLLTSLYRSRETGYPKYFKMDPLCRLGFIGAEMLLGPTPDVNGDSHAIVVIGRGGSIADDRRYQETIANDDNYFPSPAVFVYTLANIVTGEIAIRHKLYGESSSYLIENYVPETITRLLYTAFADPDVNQVTGGWIDCDSDNAFSLRIVTIDRNTSPEETLNFFKNNPI